MMHIMDRLKGKEKLIAIKVDITKAYDVIRWSFNDKILTKVGIPAKLKEVIMDVITSIRISVAWNEEKGRLF